MKQNITVEQLKGLNKEQSKKLHEIKYNTFLLRIAYENEYKFNVTDRDYCEAVFRIDIGNMIEILESQTNSSQQIINEGGRYSIATNLKGGNVTGWQTEYYNEICDALWEAVKSFL